MTSNDGSPPTPLSPRSHPQAHVPSSRVGIIILILSALAIGLATLLPGRGLVRPLPSICIFCGDYGGIDFTLNTIIFIPYGIGLYLTLRRPWLSIGIGMLTTLGIELLQLQIIEGRDTSLGDLIANTLGTAIGVYLTLGWRTWILPKPRLAGYLSWIGLAVWIGLLTLSGWALQPSPTQLKWFGQAIPDLVQFGRFRGTLLDASVDGQPLVQGELPPESPTYAAFNEGRTSVKATVTPGWRLYTGTIAPIVTMFDRREHEIFIFAQEGLSLVFRSRTKNSVLLLREPTIALPNIFPHSYPRRAQGRPTDGSRMGDTIYLSGVREPTGVKLRAVTPIATQERQFSFHIFMLWNGILPFNLPFGYGIDALSALWAAGLIFLPAYWFSWHSNKIISGIIFFGTTAAALHVIPVAFGLHTSPWWAWVASLVGAFLGWGLARFAQSRSKQTTLLDLSETGQLQRAG